jgi:hypothetical protein
VVAQIKPSLAPWSAQAEARSWAVSLVVGKERLSVLELERLVALLWAISSIAMKPRSSSNKVALRKRHLQQRHPQQLHLQQRHPQQRHLRKLHQATHNFQTVEWSESDCVLLALLGNLLFVFPH